MAEYHKTKEYRQKLCKARIERKKRLGYINSPETRIKMSIAKLGKESPNKGKIHGEHSEETKRKISNSVRGEKNHNWKGGISSLGKRIRKSLEYRQWRKQVYQRDNWTCQKCKVRGIKLEPHHIKSLSSILLKNNIKTLEEALRCKEIWDVKNGVALCKKCHSETDNFRKIVR